MTNLNPDIDPIVEAPANPPVEQQERPAEKQLREQAKLNRELQARLKAFEDEKKAEADAKLAEQGEFKKLLEAEKAEKEALKNQYLAEKRQSELSKKLANSGINPDLLDFVAPTLNVQYDDQGQPLNLDEIILDLKQSKPSLFIDTTTPKNLGINANSNGQSSNTMTKEQAINILNSGDQAMINKHFNEITKLKL
jgi:hypothetical protein